MPNLVNVRVGCLVAIVLVLCASPGASQQRPAASPFLSPEHWSHDALERLQGAGLIDDGFDPAGAGVTRLEAYQRFREASVSAQEGAPEWLELVQAYQERFAEEFPGTARLGVEETRGPTLEATLTAGVESHQNRLQPRHYRESVDAFQTRELRDHTEPAGGMGLSVLMPTDGAVSFGAHGTLQLPADRVSASEAYGVLLIGRVGVWGGRRALAFGSANGGSVVLSGDLPFDGAGLFMTDGVRLPGVLSHLGAFRFETAFAHLDSAGEVDNPWLFGTRLSLSPHPRIRIGLNRAAVFGGDHTLVPAATFGRVAKTIAGIDTDEEGRANFEDQIASLDLWLAPNLGSLPLVIYGEWGVEDLSESRTEQPAVTGGIRVPAFPGALWLNLGVEHTRFDAGDGTGRAWYDHRVFGTWTDDGSVRGHELGGEGNELRVFAGADLVDARLRIDTRVFTRNRKAGNLFAPDRMGSSKGGGLTVRWRLSPSLDLETSGVIESGSDWTESAAFVGTRLTL